MKSLQEYKELMCGKTIVERLIVNSKIREKNINKGAFSVYFPDWDKNNCEPIYDKIVKTVKFPTKNKYVIFLDHYRYNKYHFADIGDMLGNIAMNFGDYEDFNPNKDIVYSSNDYKDVLEYYFTNLLNIDLPPKDNDLLDEWVSKWDDKFVREPYADNLTKLGEIYNGIISVDEYDVDLNDPNCLIGIMKEYL